jgi:hypothetical protein
MEEEQAEKNEQEHEEQGVYLLDLAASVFAIMLIYLLIVAYQASNATRKVDISQYRPKDSQSFNFPLQTWRPMNTYLNYWILQNRTIYHLNLAAIARLFSEKGPGLIYASPGKVKISAEVPPSGGSGLPTEFSIRFDRFDAALSGPDDAVLDRSFTIGTLAGADGNADTDSVAAFSEPLSIHVLGEPTREDYRVLQAIQKMKQSSEVSFEGNGFSIDRLQLDYALSRIYR